MRIFLTLLFLFILTKTQSQITSNSQWTWVNGDKTKNNFGVYGTLGVSASTNKPGARNNCIKWTDASGNFWLFGGFGYDESNYGLLNDLWKYNPATNQWTWVSGDKTRNNFGVYGTLGVTASTNKPGARDRSLSWTDVSGNFWLYGGNGMSESNNGDLNDLWKYNPTTNQWTWVSGNKTTNNNGIYGTQGLASSTNKPGAREQSINWKDGADNFWMFGGIGNGESNYGWLNDLWKYNPATNQWTWVSGDKTVDNFGIYGTQGLASSTNKPGARDRSISWSDASGNFWLLGGNGKGESYDGWLNDLWKYNPATNQWTWVSGDKTTNNNGIYGTQGLASSTNKPGARYKGVSWKDLNDIFWLYGGDGYGESNYGYLNDLWKYNPISNQWTWVNGNKTTNINGVYGTQGLASSTNKPGTRSESICWVDANGNFWLFGGGGYAETSSFGGYLNDVWKLGVDPLPVVLGKFSLQKINNSVDITWTTENEINSKNFEVERGVDGKNFSLIGTVEAKGFASDYSFIDKKPFNGTNYYRLKQIDKDGKFEYSEIKFSRFNSNTRFEMFPNPAKSEVNISVEKLIGNGNILVTDIYGKQVKIQILKDGNNVLNITSFAKGIYFVNINTNDGLETKKLIVE